MRKLCASSTAPAAECLRPGGGVRRGCRRDHELRGVTETDVRDLVHGCIFTRGPKDLHNTAVWIGGSNMSAGEQLLAMAQDAVFAPFTVSIMLDSNGSNTTAVAAVVKIEETLGNLAGRRC